MAELKWYALETSEVLKNIDSKSEGLTDRQAAERLELFGPNSLPADKKISPLLRFIKQFDNLLIYILLASAVITLFMAHWVDSGVIFAVVVINALIGFIQEGKAEKAMDAIRNMLTFNASVTRDGKRITVPAENIVPGDIVFVESGDKIPADIRLLKVKNLYVSEAVLTGESVPVEKTVEPVPQDTVLAERFSMAFAGTLVTSGQAKGVVVTTGQNTEMGKISEMVRTVEPLQTPLLRKIAQFGRQLTVAILLLAALVFAFGVFVRNQSINDMFIAAVGLSVAAIPEGLPAIITITLAIGVNRMAKRNAIIRRLPAVETLGAVTVICSDKTGTLTRNEMTVTTVVTADSVFNVTGSGYDPHGDISLDGKTLTVDDSPQMLEIARAAMLCNDSSITQQQQQWQISGDPTEASLISFGIKCGIDHDLLLRDWTRIDVIPFESQHRFMATLNHNHQGGRFIYIKGAPETLLEMCGFQRKNSDKQPLDKSYWLRQIEQIAAQGQRALALACKPVPETLRELSFEDVRDDLILLGFCGIIDPPRQEAIQAVKACRQAGITVKMITGDHKLTAQAIGSQMGIGINESALTGEELQKADNNQMMKYAQDADVFGRVSPEHKLILVQALQKLKHIVAMTGDGVNDAPALKQADVGIAMGIKGTEVAKEASEIVLADDNFASIANAVEEGRTVYDNIRKSICFILPTNAAEALVIIIAIFLGYQLPITPVQILWVNMITAVTLSLSLAFEPSEPDVMNRPPRRPSEPILSGFLIWRIIFIASILVAGTFGLFLWDLSRNTHIETARTVAVNTLVMFEFFYLLNSRFFLKSSLSWNGLFGNIYVPLTMTLVVFFQILFTYLGPMNTLFGTLALGPTEWVRIILVSSSVFIIVEIEKFLRRLYYLKNKKAQP